LLPAIRELYDGQSERANHLRQGILFFDLVTLVFIVVTPFTPQSTVVEAIDITLALVISRSR
jgi:voltage-gated potassium channel